MNAEDMIRRIAELTKAVEVKDKRIRQLEIEIERLKPPGRPSARLERLLDKVNKKPR